MEEVLISSLRKHWLPVVLGILALILFVYGMISLLATTSTPDVTFETEKSAEIETQIAVDIEGAVVTPGVYKIKEGSLVQDALIAAGGLSEFADREWIAKNINLASKVADAQKIYIPTEGEAQADSSTSVQGADSSRVSINTAQVSELDTLPGVGPVTANKIISGRPYVSVEQLLQKKIVGQSTFDKIKDLISL